MIIKKGTKARVIANNRQIRNQGFYPDFKLTTESIIELDKDYDIENHNFVHIRYDGIHFTFNPTHLEFFTNSGNILKINKN